MISFITLLSFSGIALMVTPKLPRHWLVFTITGYQVLLITQVTNEERFLYMIRALL